MLLDFSFQPEGSTSVSRLLCVLAAPPDDQEILLAAFLLPSAVLATNEMQARLHACDMVRPQPTTFPVMKFPCILQQRHHHLQ